VISANSTYFSNFAEYFNHRYAGGNHSGSAKTEKAASINKTAFLCGALCAAAA